MFLFLQGGQGDYVESDFSSNDMMQCQDVMRLELMLMRRLGCPEWFVRLHSKTNHFVVRSRNHGIRAEMDYQLPTGCTDTTFRNTFWNSCILFTFLRAEKAKSCRALLLGDDMLARILGLKRHAAKRYESIALEAKMSAKVARHQHLVNCSFLSKSFVPREAGNHSIVPLIGKALARFNSRANRNDAVTDDAYFAAKSLSYAYEFRYIPLLRDVFLDRFNHHAPIALAQRHSLRFAEDDPTILTWSAREAGVTLRGIAQKLKVGFDFEVDHHDFNCFCLFRYNATADEMVSIFETVVLDLENSDYDGPFLAALVRDFR